MSSAHPPTKEPRARDISPTEPPLDYLQIIDGYTGNFLARWYGQQGEQHKKERSLGESARHVAVSVSDCGQRWWSVMRWMFDEEYEG